MCSQNFWTFWPKSIFPKRVSEKNEMMNISRNNEPILANEVLNESLWYQLPIPCKKLFGKSQTDFLTKTCFWHDKNVVSSTNLRPQQMRSQMKAYDTSFPLLPWELSSYYLWVAPAVTGHGTLVFEGIIIIHFHVDSGIGSDICDK